MSFTPLTQTVIFVWVRGWVSLASLVRLLLHQDVLSPSVGGPSAFSMPQLVHAPSWTSLATLVRFFYR